MYAVKGIFDGNAVVVKEPIPVKEQYEVIVTFVSSLKTNNRQKTYYENLQELNGSINDVSFVEHKDLPLNNNIARDFL